MPPLRRTERFDRDYRQLPSHIQEQVNDALEELDANTLEKWRRQKLLRDHRDVWSIRVDSDNYRLTYRLQGETKTLRRVGTHMVYESP